jgi:hypothetical protein
MDPRQSFGKRLSLAARAVVLYFPLLEMSAPCRCDP